MADQFETPLFTALRRHAEKEPIQFHIPGHKKGNGMDPEFREFIGENALSIVVWGTKFWNPVLRYLWILPNY